MLKRIGPAVLLAALSLAAAAPAVAQGIDDPTPPPTVGTPLPAVTPTAIPRPQPAALVEENGLTLALYFPSLAQGEAGLIEVRGEGLTGARARFLDTLVDFFRGADGGLYALLSVSMEQNPRAYDLAVFGWNAAGQRASLSTQVTVVTGSFILQDITMAPDRAYLVDAEIERAELARLESIFSGGTPERLWDASGFMMPILGSNLTSPFGAFRTFNGTLQTRHTGWDIRTTLGVPVLVSAAGRVAFAGRLDIRGNMVAVDHGAGVYSTYSHLSQIHVTRGQTVVRGQIIGVTGDTGRSSGPHFHWEIAVNGDFVDSVRFTNTWLP